MQTNQAETSRAVDHVIRCSEDLTKAMAARDAIENCASPEWRLAHAKAREAAVAKDNAFNHAYSIKALPKPYWA